jgi:hypothetical protein
MRAHLRDYLRGLECDDEQAELAAQVRALLEVKP